MAKLKDLKRTPPKILLYGVAGTGKTAFALTGGSLVEVMDFDQGLTTGLTLDDDFKSARGEVEVSSFLDTKPSVATAFSTAKAHLLKIANLANAGKYEPKILVIDSLTSMADAALRYILANSTAVKVEIQHWGLAFTEIENFLNVARSMPVVLVLIAHVMSVEVDEQVKEQIDIPGKKLPNKVTRYFDEIWYAKVRNLPQNKRDYLLQTKPTSSILCRSRNGIEDGLSMNLGLIKILEKMGYSFDKETS